jgi:hypothetical protein
MSATYHISCISWRLLILRLYFYLFGTIFFPSYSLPFECPNGIHFF